MSLIAGKILEIDNLANMAQMLAMYVVTVLLGLIIHALISLPLLFFICTRKNPFTYMRGLLHAWITALGTASRFITLLIYKILSKNAIILYFLLTLLFTSIIYYYTLLLLLLLFFCFNTFIV